MRALDEISIAADELEAMRLVFVEGLYQEQAAEIMGISRQTLGRILTGAQTRLTEALIEGKAIRIERAEHAIPSGNNDFPQISCIGRRRCRHRGRETKDETEV